MTKQEIIDNLELYTVGRLKKDQVSITIEELQNLIDEIKALEREIGDDCEYNRGYRDGYDKGNLNGYELRKSEEKKPDDCISKSDVDQNIYDYAESNGLSYANLKNAILDVPPAIPTIPKGATNGGVIKAMLNPYKVCEYEYSVHVYMTEEDFWRSDYQMNCNARWWNAPYK